MDVSPATEFMSVSQDVLPVFTGIPVKANVRNSTKMGMKSLCFKMLGLGPDWEIYLHQNCVFAFSYSIILY